MDKAVKPLRAVDQRALRRHAPKRGRDRLRYAASILLHKLLLNVDVITTTIEGIGSITPITEARFKDWVEIWKKCVILEEGFWDMAISLSEVSRQCHGFSIALDIARLIHITQEANRQL
jgi:hypothetical protein